MSISKFVLVVAIIWLLIGIGFVSFYSKFDWDVLLGFATWVLAAGVAFAIWQIIETRENTNRQLEASRKSTNAQIAMDLFKELRDKKTMAEIRKIYNLPDNYSEPENEYQTGIIEYLISRLNILGVLVEKGLIDKELAPDAYAGTTSLRCWYKLHKYIWKERCKRKYFGEYFESYTNRCCQHFEDNNIEVGFSTIDDLVKKLLNAKEEQDKSKKMLYPRSLQEIREDRKKEREIKQKDTGEE